jgi:hypothetical protein
MSATSSHPLFNRGFQSFLRVPGLFQLELLINSNKGDIRLKPFLQMAFNYADNYQRVRITLEALAVMVYLKASNSYIEKIFWISFHETSQLNTTAKLLLIISGYHAGYISEHQLSAFLENILPSEDNLEEYDYSIIPDFFFLFQKLTQKINQQFEKFKINQEARKLNSLQEFYKVLEDYDNFKSHPHAYNCLINSFQLLRTDYLKHCAAKIMVHRAVQNNCEILLDHLHYATLKHVVKRNRKSGILSSLAIGYFMLGNLDKAIMIKNEIWSCYIEEGNIPSGYDFCNKVLEFATNKQDRIYCLKEIKRRIYTSINNKEDREALEGFSKLLQKTWDSFNKNEKDSLNWFLSFHLINKELHPNHFIEEQFSNKMDISKYRQMPHQQGTDNNYMISWLKGINCLMTNETTNAKIHFEAGWKNIFDKGKNYPEIFFASKTIIRYLISHPNELTAYFENLFMRYRQIPDEGVFSESMASFKKDQNICTLDFSKAFYNEIHRYLYSEKIDEISDSLICKYPDLKNKIKLVQKSGRNLMVQTSTKTFLLKTDPFGNELFNLQYIKKYIPDNIHEFFDYMDHTLILAWHDFQIFKNMEKYCLEEAIDELCKVLVKFHLTKTKLHGSFIPSRPYPKTAYDVPISMNELVENLRLKIPLSHQEIWEKAEKIYSDFTKPRYQGDNQEYLIHGDLHDSNILYFREGKRIVLCDWGDMRIGHREEDLAKLAIGLSPDLAELFIKSYMQKTIKPISMDIFEHYLSIEYARQIVAEIIFHKKAG